MHFRFDRKGNSEMTASVPTHHSLPRHRPYYCAADDQVDPYLLLARVALARRTGEPARIRRAEQDATACFLSYASAQARHFQGRGVELDDLVQIARLGLIKAVRGWDPHHGTAFLQYAKSMIVGELKRYFRDHSALIRPSRHLQEVGTAIAMAGRTLGALDHLPTDEEVALAAGVTVEEVRADREVSQRRLVSSLDRAVDDGLSLPECESAAAQMESVESRMLLRQAFRRLSERERHLIKLRFFDEHTQEEIGRAIGVSQMQVSRLLQATLRKMRGTMTAA